MVLRTANYGKYLSLSYAVVFGSVKMNQLSTIQLSNEIAPATSIFTPKAAKVTLNLSSKKAAKQKD